MKAPKKYTVLVSIFFTLLMTFSARSHATQRYNIGIDGISAAGGIAHSSKNLGAFQNPSSLIYGNSLAADITVFKRENDQKPSFGGSVLFGGKEIWGGAVGIQHFMEGQGTSQIFFGLAGYLDPIKTAFGFSGRSSVDQGSNTIVDAGITIYLERKCRLGLTAYDFSHDANYMGAGLIFDIDPAISLLADVTADKNIKHIAAAPGVLVGTKTAALTLSYSLKISSDEFASPAFKKGAMAGFVLKFTAVTFGVYYQQPEFGKYYSSLAFDI